MIPQMYRQWMLYEDIKCLFHWANFRHIWQLHRFCSGHIKLKLRLRSKFQICYYICFLSGCRHLFCIYLCWNLCWNIYKGHEFAFASLSIFFYFLSSKRSGGKKLYRLTRLFCSHFLCFLKFSSIHVAVVASFCFWLDFFGSLPALWLVSYLFLFVLRLFRWSFWCCRTTKSALCVFFFLVSNLHCYFRSACLPFCLYLWHYEATVASHRIFWLLTFIKY